MRTLLHRILELVRRDARERRLAEEIETHLGLLAEEYERQGMPAEAARDAARRSFGGVDQVKERCRDQRGLRFVETLWQDVRYGARLLAKDRWFTAATVIALAMGIAVSTIVFTIIYSMNLRSLPFEQPERLVALGIEPTRATGANPSYATFEEWRKRARTFSGIAAHTDATVTLAGEGQPAESVVSTSITAGGFEVLGELPRLGREFLPEDERREAPPVVILGHHLWNSRFGGAPDVLGRAVRVNGVPSTIVGVMPDGFRYPFATDIWQPLASLASSRSQTATGAGRVVRGVNVLARLAEGVTLDQARAELAALMSTSQMEPGDRDARPTVMPLNERWFGTVTQPAPLLIMVAGTLVLLIACTHAANLLLARSAAREREIAMRVAIGAGRARIVRQLLVESVLLSTIAGVMSLGLSIAGVRLFAREVSDFGLPYWTTFSFDARVFAFLATVCLGTGVMFGMAPALQLARLGASPSTGAGARVIGQPARRRWGGALMVAQLAVTVTLLSGAAVALRTAFATYDSDNAIDPSSLWTMRLSLGGGKYANVDQRRAFYERLEARLEAFGPSPVTVASTMPFFGAEPRRAAMVESGAFVEETTRPVMTVAIGARYFETLDLSLRAGRRFSAGDGRPGGEVAIVNDRFVAMFSPDRDPIGRRVWLTSSPGAGAAGPIAVTIVGIVPSVRQSPATNHDPVVYLPLAAQPGPAAVLIARDTLGGLRSAARLREAVRALDSEVPLSGFQALERISEKSRWIPRVTSTMLTAFSAIGIVLSAIGVYALTAYGVARRTQEIGLRMALGATAWQIGWLCLREMAARAFVGLGIGAMGGVGLGMALRGLLVDTRSTPPAIVLLISALFSSVVAAAAYGPARRAARLDPVVALRRE